MWKGGGGEDEEDARRVIGMVLHVYLLGYRKMSPFCLGTPNHLSRATNYAEYISLS
jgi:hypothetical protein